MALITDPFQFASNATISVAASTTSTAAALPVTGQAQQVMIGVPAGGPTAIINFGSSTITALSSTSPSLPAGTNRVFSVSGNTTYIAAATSSGTASISVTCGFGR